MKKKRGGGQEEAEQGGGGGEGKGDERKEWKGRDGCKKEGGSGREVGIKG